MERFIYLGVDCKAEGCNRFHALRYVGIEGNPEPETHIFKVAIPLSLRCPYCRETHPYRAANVRRYVSDDPPLPDFRNLI